MEFEYEQQLLLAGLMFYPPEFRPMIADQGLAVIDKNDGLVLALSGKKLLAPRKLSNTLIPIPSLSYKEAAQKVYQPEFLQKGNPSTIVIQ